MEAFISRENTTNLLYKPPPTLTSVTPYPSTPSAAQEIMPITSLAFTGAFSRNISTFVCQNHSTTKVIELKR